MSYVSTYERRTPKPKGVALAIGVHAVIIGAVLAMPGIEIIPKDKKIIDAFLIPNSIEPREVIEDQKPEIEIPLETKITAPIPEIDDLPKAPATEISEFSGAEDISLGGSGEGVEFPIQPLEPITPIPEPVIVQAKLNPRYARQFQPRYPSGLLRMDIEGNVSVRVLVGTNGRVKDIQLLSSPQPEFWESTRKHALRKWRFQPATKDGKPIEGWINLKVRFEINS